MESWSVIGKMTTLNGAGTVALAIGIIAVLLLPRRSVPVAFLGMACFVTIGQQLVFLSLSFSIIRLMVAATLVRVVLRKETGPGCLTALDRALLVWVAVGTTFYLFRLGSYAALVSRLGSAYDAIGLFFIFRHCVRDNEDLKICIRFMAIAIVPLTLLMCLEKVSGQNPFAVFGGVPQYTQIREGYLRVQGPFRHPVLAGIFAAMFFPLFASLWHVERSQERLLLILGILCSIIIVALTASSSPIIALGTALFSYVIWGLRKHTKTLWQVLVVGLIALDVAMKAPIWYVIDRLGNVLGGTGYHRALLIDQTIRHFDEWWLAGTSYTAHWMPYALAADPTKADITNQFILEGVDGGIFTLCAFIVLVAIAFRTLATAIRAGVFNVPETRVIWGLWGSLLTNVVSFLSISYFDQMQVFWLLLLACISSVSRLSYSAPRIDQQVSRAVSTY